jgi:hypothetical protein|tara:strand:+ start:3343 stop:3681 length:339 start_codon:yes stop_codon:yes gene_type:complete
MDESEFEEESESLKDGRVYIILEDSKTQEEFEKHGFFKVVIFDTTEDTSMDALDIEHKPTSLVMAQGLFAILANSPDSVFEEGVKLIHKEFAYESYGENIISLANYRKNRPH